VARPRAYATNAERQAAYRRRLAERRQVPLACVETGDCTLLQGDARVLWPTLKDIDVILTDPPYSAVTHNGARGGGFQQTPLIEFAAMTDETAVDLAQRCCVLARRWVVMTMDWRHAAAIEQRCPESFVRAGVWIKSNAAPQFTGDRPGTGWEAIVMLHRPGKKHWNGGGQHAVWNIPRATGPHPTAKPLRLLHDWVQQFSDPGETILDPFMGSGTTGVACVELGRKFIGIEQDPVYFALACQRIRAAAAQGRLFAPAVKVQQGALFACP
jgi:site-specific DNA-methyltransferase (adenine-specific)